MVLAHLLPCLNVMSGTNHPARIDIPWRQEHSPCCCDLCARDEDDPLPCRPPKRPTTGLSVRQVGTPEERRRAILEAQERLFAAEMAVY
jgi:hypothetical protein